MAFDGIDVTGNKPPNQPIPPPNPPVVPVPTATLAELTTVINAMREEMILHCTGNSQSNNGDGNNPLFVLANMRNIRNCSLKFYPDID